jgi:hypothetical protein
MALPAILAKVFGDGGGKILDGVGKILDNVITNKEELETAKRETQKVVNQHIQEMYKLSNEQFKTEVEDRHSARGREAEFVKATGHIDYLMWALAIAGLGLLFFLIWHLVKTELPDKNKELIAHGIGIIEGVVISIYSYYFGSSAGSRIKDMKK